MQGALTKRANTEMIESSVFMERLETIKASNFMEEVPYSIRQPSRQSPPGHPVLRLQQTVGNRAVQRLLRDRAIPATLQTRQSNDIFDREADRVMNKEEGKETLYGKRLPAHELTHAVQQSRSAAIGIKIQRQTNPCIPKESEPLPGVTTLPAEELANRRKQIQEAINQGKADYPIASDNIQHWLDNSGTDKILPLASVNFASEDSGVPQHLNDVHRLRIAKEDKDGNIQGITRRLNPGDTESLYPPGTERTLKWIDSMRAKAFKSTLGGIVRSPQLELDLAVALGGFTVYSEVRIRALDPSPDQQIKEVEVLSWKVQVCDIYDWIKDARANIIIPPGMDVPKVIPEDSIDRIDEVMGFKYVRVNDNWFAQVQKSGGAKTYKLFSEIFEAPANVKRNFSVSNGVAAP
jgi:hypothetical protein